MVVKSLRTHWKIAQLSLVFLMLVGLALSTSTSWAQQTGQITGRITDADSKEYLPGANVMLKGTGFGASTDRNGLFRIGNVPFGDFEIVVRYIGYEEASTPVTVSGASLTKDISLKPSVVLLSGVQITGLRQGQNKALNIQKTSDNILNVVSQEQMLRLPDLNTAEILQRIPGISIVRDQGEGRYVQIRGTDARLTSVSVNGEKIIAPDAGQRYVGMDVISASQAASIEVSKTVTPDMDGDAVGGSVNIKTKSAFDAEKSFLNVTAGSGTSAIMGKTLWQGGFSFGTKFGPDDVLGIAITGNYDNWERENWDLENTWDVKTIGGVTYQQVMTDMDIRNYHISRERFNLAGNFDYQPSGNNSYFIRGMFNNRDDYEYRRSLYVRPSKGTITSPTTSTKAKIYTTLKDRLERQDIFALSVGAIHKMGNLNLDYTVAYNEGRTEKHGETDPQFVMSTTPSLTLDLSNPSRIQYTNTSSGATFDQYNPDNYKFDQIKLNNDDATDRDYMGGANAKYSFKLADHPSELKFGAKVHIREKVKTQDRWVYNWKGASNLLMTQFAGEEATIYDGTYKVGRVIDGNKNRAYFASQKDVATGFMAKGGTWDHINSEGASFTADENTMAYYAMDTWNIDELMIIAGVRHEFTDVSNTSYKILLGPGGTYLSTTKVDGSLNYNNFLPSLQFRYKLTPMSNIRASYTNTLARPNFFDIVPYQQVDVDNLLVSQGNATLMPTTATNLDLLAEHYFQGGGLVTAGVFYKKLNDIIFTQTIKIAGGTYDGYWLTQPVNGGSSTLVGFEFNFETQLGFLPSFLNGLGVAVNYAYTHSTADVGTRLTRSELPGQAANVGNFVLSYEKYGFSGRYSIGYNGKFIEAVGIDAQRDRIYKEHMQMDLSASQDLFAGLQVYFEWINLNKEPMIYYQGDENHPLQQEYYSWWMHFGLKFKI